MISHEQQLRSRRWRMYAAMTTLFVMFAGYGGSAFGQDYPVPPPPTPMPPPPPTPPPTPPTPPPMANTFAMTPLVSNGAVAAMTTDTGLINPWGIAAGPDTPMWVANNATQTATVYDGTGIKQPLTVNLPAGANGPANATGMIFNATMDFVLTNGNTSAPANFVFDGESGTLFAWSQAIDPANALLVYDDGAGGAVYKALAAATDGTANFLYAADFHNNKVDVFDREFHKIEMPGAFADPELPAGYAPFGIQAVQIGGVPRIFVAYAMRQPDSDEEVKGAGLGVINVFDVHGTLLQHLVPAGGNLNAPWGVALAPEGFGALSNMVLIGNFGDGVINAYDPNSGAFVDSIKDAAGQPIVNEGLWGIAFGNGTNNQPTTTLYFAAGIADETAGLFGRIDAQ